MLIVFAHSNFIENCNNINLDIELSNTQFDKNILNKR